MSGHGDDRAVRALRQALEKGPQDVLDLLAAVRRGLGASFELHEGALHAILHGEVRRGRILAGGFSERGLTLYRLEGTPAPTSDQPPPLPEPLEPGLAKAALRAAASVRDAAERGRVHADVLAHLQSLEERDQRHRFGSVRGLRHLLHRVDRGRPAVCLTATGGDVARRLLLHEGPWLLGAVLIFFVLKLLVLQVYMIPSESMLPTLREGDRVVVFYGSGDEVPERWRIVTFELDDGKTYVKRVVGLPGEEIAIFNGDVYVDGERLVKPDAVREALRSALHRWDLTGEPPAGWRVDRDSEGRTWRWQRTGFDAHDDGPSFALRDGYLELEAERPARGEVTLGLARGPGPEGGRLEWTLELGVQGIVLRETRYEGEQELGREILATETSAPPTGRVRLDLSYVDGVLRAGCADWSWRGTREAPDEALIPRVSVRREGCRPLALRLDRDLHYSHTGEHGVPGPGDRELVQFARRILQGHVFVLGDNTTNSQDSRSREKGDIPVARVVGPVSFRIWPPGRIGSVK